MYGFFPRIFVLQRTKKNLNAHIVYWIFLLALANFGNTRTGTTTKRTLELKNTLQYFVVVVVCVPLYELVQAHTIWVPHTPDTH